MRGTILNDYKPPRLRYFCYSSWSGLKRLVRYPNITNQQGQSSLIPIHLTDVQDVLSSCIRGLVPTTQLASEFPPYKLFNMLIIWLWMKANIIMLHNYVSVNNGLYAVRWFHKVIRELENSHFPEASWMWCCSESNILCMCLWWYHRKQTYCAVSDKKK